MCVIVLYIYLVLDDQKLLSGTSPRDQRPKMSLWDYICIINNMEKHTMVCFERFSDIRSTSPLQLGQSEATMQVE